MRRRHHLAPATRISAPFSARLFGPTGAYEGPSYGDGLMQEIFLGALEDGADEPFVRCVARDGGYEDLDEDEFDLDFDLD